MAVYTFLAKATTIEMVLCADDLTPCEWVIGGLINIIYVSFVFVKLPGDVRRVVDTSSTYVRGEENLKVFYSGVPAFIHNPVCSIAANKRRNSCKEQLSSKHSSIFV